MTDWTVPAAPCFLFVHRLRLNPEVLCFYYCPQGDIFSRSQYFSITHQRTPTPDAFVASGAVLANTCRLCQWWHPKDKMRAFVRLSNIPKGYFCASRKVREIHSDITTSTVQPPVGITTLLFEIIFHVNYADFRFLMLQFYTYEYEQYFPRFYDNSTGRPNWGNIEFNGNGIGVLSPISNTLVFVVKGRGRSHYSSTAILYMTVGSRES